ncbi:hypothetical protein HDU79_010382 [Rhizoclosmatium sp. JEL0117]|nr:hypothetical protein HDU79_010382 [Rhizoclosmatium sp. JEL0117]
MNVTSTTNTTLPAAPAPPSISNQQFAVLGLMVGNTLEVAIGGIISIGIFHLSGENPGKGSMKINWTSLLMVNFNFAAIIYMAWFIADWWLDGSNCVIGSILDNAASHYFYLSFDLFILFKTCVISGYNRVVVVMAAVIYLNRMSWSALDIAKSGGSWDPDGQLCSYVQFPLSGLGYNASDIITDLFASVVSVIFTLKHIKSGFNKIGQVIMQENVLRSLIMLGVNCFEMYASFTITSPFLTLVAYMIQNYTYTRCLNLEIMWIGVRRRSAKTGKKQAGSSNSTSFFSKVVKAFSRSEMSHAEA